MAKLSSDGKYVTVEKGDTLSGIASKYGNGKTYKQLATINKISNPDRIYVGQKIYLTSDGSSSPSSKTSSSNKVTIDEFGIQSNTEKTLFVTWSWAADKERHTKEYKLKWFYATGDGVSFVGKESTNTVDKDYRAASRQSTYDVPENATKVWVKIKPISETYEKNKKETVHFTAEWAQSKTFLTNTLPLAAPSTPTVEIEGTKLTATLDNIDIDGATHIKFVVVRNNSASSYATEDVKIVRAHASHQFTIDVGSEYKVRCCAYRSSDDTYGEWSDYSDNKATMPATPAEITTIRATSETSVYLEWKESTTAETYEIQYTTKQTYFDTSDEVSSKTGIKFAKFEVTGLGSGEEYFFRVRAVNGSGESPWSEIKSVVVGTTPSAPTTWSSTTTAIVDEEVTLYWVHNSEDGSKQSKAFLELNVGSYGQYTTTLSDTAINNEIISYTPLTEEEKEDGKTSSCVVHTSRYSVGAKIEWRVQTAGVTGVYGDWSTMRTIDLHAPATLELSVTDANGDPLDTIESFPFYLKGLPGPNTQLPVGYHVAITSNEIYETNDSMGDPKFVNVGEAVYSKFFDVSSDLLVEFSAGNVDLENGVSYTLTCTVSMNSGLTATKSLTFTVDWAATYYEPNAEISIDPDTFSASIRPYCENRTIVYYQVTAEADGTYTRTPTVLDYVYGEPVAGAVTAEGDHVLSGTTASGEDVYFCTVEEVAEVTGVLLSVYRREFDGGFTELAKNLDIAKGTSVTDPHPALDLARYRIVATDAATGAVSYYDLPGYPVGGTAVIIQWNEAWVNYEVSNEDALAQPSWSGSMLKLPYNIDVSDSNSKDVALVEYAGRKDPVAYYGTHRGHKSNWNVTIPKSDRETVYALRRLQNWMGDVYVREPSGSGYWANIAVSFNQKHKDMTIPVTLEVTRVEGGM